MRGVRGWSLCAIVTLASYAGAAHADQVSTRADQLRSADEYKVRLSAALWLSSQNDERAVAALTFALDHDRERTVRSVAAISLGKLVDESVPLRVRDRAITALERAAVGDPDGKVRQSAARAFVRVKALRGRGSQLGAVFVAVGTPTDMTGDMSGTHMSGVQQAMRRALREHAPEFGQSTHAEGLPTRAELDAASSQGFFVNAAVAELRVAESGGRTEVRCTVNMRVSSWTGADGDERMREREAALASGRGRVIGAGTRAGLAHAQRDCVLAVVEEITSRQIVPFVKRRLAVIAGDLSAPTLTTTQHSAAARH
jgi:hypothetical protein